MAKCKYIRTDVYRRGIVIFLGTRAECYEWAKKTFTNEEDRTLLNDLKDDVDNKDSIGTVYNLGGGQSLVWLPKYPKSIKEIASFTHEMLHATMNLLDYCGVEYRYNGNNEPHTYLLEFFVTKGLEKGKYKDV